MYAGSFRVSVIHRTLTWTTGSLTCVRDHYYACVYTRGLGTPTASQQNNFDSEKLTILCVCSRRGSNLGSLDLKSDALPIEPPRHPVTPSACCSAPRSSLVPPCLSAILCLLSWREKKPGSLWIDLFRPSSDEDANHVGPVAAHVKDP